LITSLFVNAVCRHLFGNPLGFVHYAAAFIRTTAGERTSAKLHFFNEPGHRLLVWAIPAKVMRAHLTLQLGKYQAAQHAVSKWAKDFAK
jgi:hypothetical protein